MAGAWFRVRFWCKMRPSYATLSIKLEPMPENESQNAAQPSQRAKPQFRFGAEIELEEAGFSFQPISGFELEVDGSVYMYSEDGNLEVSLVGGMLGEQTSIADLNDELAGEFMENFDEFHLTEAGTDTIQDITGFLNQIRFTNTGEEGRGCALICSPYVNQYFFILVISSAEHWEARGEAVYQALKSRIRFYPQFREQEEETSEDAYPDLTIESFRDIDPEDNFLLHIEKGDTSLLLAARSQDPQDEVWLTRITTSDNRPIYQFDPESNALQSSLSVQPLIGVHGELCFFFPRDTQETLQPGDYQFGFGARSGLPLEEIQVIIRTGRALEQQAFDLNLWFACADPLFGDEVQIAAFTSDLREALQQRLSPLNLVPGKIDCVQAAPDELTAFTEVHVETDLADASYMISESVGNMRALNVGIVSSLTNDTGAAPKAVCAGSPGMILTSASPHACILLAWPAFEGDLALLANQLIEQMVIFSGIDAQQAPGQPLTLNREVAWRLRRHPLFYNAD